MCQTLGTWRELEVEELFFLTWVLVPAYTFYCLALAIWWRRRSPLWLPLSAALALLALVAFSALDLVGWASGTDRNVDLINIVWCSLAALCLLLAARAVQRNWRSRGLLTVVGLLVATPLMALVFSVGLSHGMPA